MSCATYKGWGFESPGGLGLSAQGPLAKARTGRAAPGRGFGETTPLVMIQSRLIHVTLPLTQPRVD
jgi:hypothetical protein